MSASISTYIHICIDIYRCTISCALRVSNDQSDGCTNSLAYTWPILCTIAKSIYVSYSGTIGHAYSRSVTIAHITSLAIADTTTDPRSQSDANIPTDTCSHTCTD